MPSPESSAATVDTCDECAKANVGPCPHVIAVTDLRSALEGARLAIQEDDQEDALAFIAAAEAAIPDAR